MSDVPPDDIDELLRGLEEALAGAGVDIDDPAFWDQVRDEVGQAVDEALDAADQRVPVVVLDGGGAGRATPADRSHLRVAGPGDEPPRPVRVVRVATRKPGRAAGRIQVREGAWQTLVRASQPRAYRVVVRDGSIDVAVDGELVERLEPGQSLDVEGAVVRVHGVSAARGSYERLA